MKIICSTTAARFYWVWRWNWVNQIAPDMAMYRLCCWLDFGCMTGCDDLVTFDTQPAQLEGGLHVPITSTVYYVYIKTFDDVTTAVEGMKCCRDLQQLRHQSLLRVLVQSVIPANLVNYAQLNALAASYFQRCSIMRYRNFGGVDVHRYIEAGQDVSEQFYVEEVVDELLPFPTDYKQRGKELASDNYMCPLGEQLPL